jgi:hypothetical protein
MSNERAYDPNRLRRAATRPIKPIGPRQFYVKGNVEKVYTVDLDADVPCTCMDAFYHGRGCLHELAARLASGELPLIQALGDMLLKAEQQNQALQRTRRAS